MKNFTGALKDSLTIFAANPKLIIPKLIISFLYSITLLLTAAITEEAIADATPEALISMLLVLGAVVGISLLDIVISAMYPFLVRDVKAGKKVALISSLKHVLSNAGKILPPLVLLEFGFIALTFVISIPLSLLIASDDAYTLIFTGIYLLLILAVVFFFYSLYPLVAYEKVSIVESFRRSIKISLKNKAGVAKATAISFVLSALSVAIAFTIEFMPQDGETALFWISFVIIRFLTAYVYTYMYVLNPVFYLDYAAKPAAKK